MSRYSIEKFVRVYNDDDGYFWQIGPDPDGVGLICLAYGEGKGDPSELTSMPIDAARLVAHAILDACKDQTE